MTSPRTPSPPGLPHSATTGREHAVKAPAPLTAVRPKDDAEGVLSALPCTVLTEDEASTTPGYGPIAWLTVQTPFRRPPTATSTCACGRNLSARGRADVLDLIAAHEYHRTACALRTSQEGRNAA
ncbi:hypothetical protein ACFVY1_20440 [Streptomyces sp. NPDC058293]|uniref:hypothetical protein n=1 Tax=Streptomyces sp. NPDC058293 TaxID=3346429 RepID=UPI0036EF4110